MKFRPDNVTVVEADAIQREYVASILTDAGYHGSLARVRAQLGEKRSEDELRSIRS